MMDAVRQKLRTDGMKPAPLITEPYLRGFRHDSHYWSWDVPPSNVADVLLAGEPLYVLAGADLFWLRDARKATHRLTGRIVEVSVSDYIFMSSKKTPPVIKPSRITVVENGLICVPCFFSITSCDDHD